MIICNSDFNSVHLITLIEWLDALWPPFKSFEKNVLGLEMPSPVLALEENVLLGGLSFSAYEAPDEASTGLWINAVYVHDEHRGRGIASKLIQFAEKEASKKAYTALYAKTDVSALYLSIGWKIVNRVGKDVIVRKDLL